jgi:hypothetical protein
MPDRLVALLHLVGLILAACAMTLLLGGGAFFAILMQMTG